MFIEESKEKKFRNILLKRQSARNVVFCGVTIHGVQGWGHIGQNCKRNVKKKIKFLLLKTNQPEMLKFVCNYKHP